MGIELSSRVDGRRSHLARVSDFVSWDEACLVRCTRTIDGYAVGAAEKSLCLPGSNLMPSKAPFKTCSSFIIDINFKIQENARIYGT